MSSSVSAETAKKTRPARRLAPCFVRKNVAQQFFLLLALFGLASCGFQPLYGTGGGAGKAAANAELASVFIDSIPNREGQMLRNNLIDRFYTSGRPVQPLYTLSMTSIQERGTRLDITKTSDTTRNQLRLSSKMVLKDRQSGEILLARELSASASYDVLSSQFTTRVSEQDARDNALQDLARQVETQLALYFGR